MFSRAIAKEKKTAPRRRRRRLQRLRRRGFSATGGGGGEKQRAMKEFLATNELGEWRLQPLQRVRRVKRCL